VAEGGRGDGQAGQPCGGGELLLDGHRRSSSLCFPLPATLAAQDIG